MWALIQYELYPYRKRRLRHRYTQGKSSEDNRRRWPSPNQGEASEQKWSCQHLQFSSVQKLSCVWLFVSNSLQPHGLQHARLPCPSPAPGAYSNSCPSSQWYHPTTSSSVVPFSSCLQSFPASGSFQMSQFFTSGDHILVLDFNSPGLWRNISVV